MPHHSLPHDKAITAFQWQVRLRLFAKQVLAWSSAWGLTWGVATLILRYTLHMPF